MVYISRQGRRQNLSSFLTIADLTKNSTVMSDTIVINFVGEVSGIILFALTQPLKLNKCLRRK